MQLAVGLVEPLQPPRDCCCMSELELDLYMPLPFPIKPKYHLQKLDLSAGVPFSSRVARMEGLCW